MSNLNKKTYKILNNVTFKITLFYYTSSTKLSYKLKPNDDFDFQKIIDICKNDTLKFLYFNKLNIDNSDEIIYINFDLNKLSDYFYLSLLVTYNRDKINFKYSINTINNLYNQEINEQDIHDSNLFQKIIKLKIVLDLIYNYKGYEDYDDIKLSSIIENINNITKENINVFKELNLLDNNNNYNVNNIKIDKLYIEIIIYLIKNNKLEDYEYIYNIMEKLDLEFIDLTETMIQDLLKILDENNNYIKQYIIANIDDLLNIKKTNFYYILLKYILKDSFYIYQIPFLLKTRIKIIKIINSNLKGLLSININEDNNEMKSRIEYILKALIDLEYYYFKYIKFKLNEILNYYKNFYIESKENDIILIEEEIRKKQIKKSEKYLYEFNKAQKLNKRAPIINYLYNEQYKQNNINNKEETIENIIKLWNSLEKIINEKSYEKIDIEYKQILIAYFKNEKNKDLLLEIFSKDIYNDFIQSNIYNLNIKDSIDNNLLSSFKLEYDSKSEINNQNINDSTQLKTKKNENIDIKSGNTSKSNNSLNLSNLNKKSFSINPDSIIFIKYERKLDYSKNIIKFNKMLKLLNNEKKNEENGNCKTLDFIKEIKGNNKYYYIIGGLYNNLYMYDNDYLYKYDNDVKKPFKFKDQDKDIFDDNIIYSVSEIKNGTKKDNITEIVLSCVNRIYLIHIFFPKDNIKEKITIRIDGYRDYPSLFVMETDTTNQKKQIIFSDKGLCIFNDLFNKIVKEKKQNLFSEMPPIYSGVSILRNLIAFTSNTILSKNKGNTILFFCDIDTKRIFQKQINYSANLTINNLSLMEYIKNNNKNQLLLCACKKYKKNQKNGIFSLNISDQKTNFKNTKSFEVYCFCQIFIYEKKKNTSFFNNNYDNYERIKTNYFLVGGFEIGKSKGIIKLYKFIYNKKKKEVNIKYIKDIILKDENGGISIYIKGPISCIFQSNDDGKIIVTSWDNNIYLFDPPDINCHYLRKFKKEE